MFLKSSSLISPGKEWASLLPVHDLSKLPACIISGNVERKPQTAAANPTYRFPGVKLQPHLVVPDTS